MFKRTLLTAAVVMFTVGILSVPAQAGHCPKDVKAIDAAMASAKLTSAQKTQVMSLRNKGDAQHKAGKHGASIATLHQALAILGKSH